MENDLDFSWFDLKSYEPVQDFTLFDWYVQLASRLCFKKTNGLVSMGITNEYRWFQHTQKLDKYSLFGFHNEVQKNNSIYFDKIKESPILNTNFTPECVPIFRDIDHKSLPAVRSAVLGEICLQHDQLNEGLDVPLLHNDESINTSLIAVDFNAPEKVLIEQFKVFVKEKKKLNNNLTAKTFSEADISSWVKSRVLPCIDLLIYADLNNTIILQHQLGSMLFPDAGRVGAPDIDVTDRVRKSILPKARKLLTNETILALQHQLSA